MIPGISTQIFLPQLLTTALLDTLRNGGAHAIELFAARWHIDYTGRPQTRELAAWFRANPVLATLHAPLTTDTHFSRHAAPNLNLLDPDRGRRIAAMDEIKRAMELAESFPIRSCVLHLGTPADTWSERALEHSLTAVEHLQAFAAPLGMKLLLENLRNEVATPAHLLEILRVGHFTTCGICLDVAHAHLAEGIPQALTTLEGRIQEFHLSDNTGHTDDHFWPASGTERPPFALQGTIDWPATYALLEPLDTIAILEIADTQAGSPQQVTQLLTEVLSHRRHLLEQPPTPTQPD